MVELKNLVEWREDGVGRDFLSYIYQEVLKEAVPKMKDVRAGAKKLSSKLKDKPEYEELRSILSLIVKFEGTLNSAIATFEKIMVQALEQFPAEEQVTNE